MCCAMIFHVPNISLIFSQIASPDGVTSLVFQVFISLFFFTIIISVFRVFINLSEIDKGRFLGHEKSIFSGSHKYVKIFEFGSRALMALTVLLFIASFVRLPFNTLDQGDFWRVSPNILTDINEACLIKKSIESNSLGEFDMDRCIKNKISEARSEIADDQAGGHAIKGSVERSSTLYLLANKFMLPAWWFLLPTFVFMIIWSLFAISAARESSEDGKISNSVLQMFVWSILLFVNLLIFLIWFSFAQRSNSKSHLYGIAIESGLFAMSLLGIVVSCFTIIVILLRTWNYRQIISTNWKNFRAALVGEKAQNVA